MIFSKGGMGTRKHRTSGTSPKNTRQKRQEGYKRDREEKEASKKKTNTGMSPFEEFFKLIK